MKRDRVTIVLDGVHPGWVTTTHLSGPHHLGMKGLRTDPTVTAALSTMVRPVPPFAGTSSSVVPDEVARLGSLVNIAEQGVLSDRECAMAQARPPATRRLTARTAGAGGWAANPEAAARPPHDPEV
jgi:hypothetical protein